MSYGLALLHTCVLVSYMFVGAFLLRLAWTDLVQGDEDGPSRHQRQRAVAVLPTMLAVLALGCAPAVTSRYLGATALAALLWLAAATGTAWLLARERNGGVLALSATWLLGLGLQELVAHQRDLLRPALRDGALAGLLGLGLVLVLWAGQTRIRRVLEAWRRPSRARVLVLGLSGLGACVIFRSQVWAAGALLVLPPLAAAVTWACQRRERIATPSQWARWWGPVALGVATGIVPVLCVRDWAPAVVLVATFAVLAAACGERSLGLVVAFAWALGYAAVRWVSGDGGSLWAVVWKPVERTTMVTTPDWAPNLQAYLGRLALAHGGLAGEGILADWRPLPLASTDGIVPCWGLQFGWIGMVALFVAVASVLVSWAATARRATTPTSRALAWEGALLFGCTWALCVAPWLRWPLFSLMGLAAPFLARGGWGTLFWILLAGATVVASQSPLGREAFVFVPASPRLVPERAQRGLLLAGGAFACGAVVCLAWCQLCVPSRITDHPARDIQAEQQAIVLRDAGFVSVEGGVIRVGTGRELSSSERHWFRGGGSGPEQLVSRARRFAAAGVYWVSPDDRERVSVRSDRTPFVVYDPWQTRALRRTKG